MVWGRSVSEPKAPTVADRAGYARVALAAHAQLLGDPPDRVTSDSIVHLLGDLMHLSMELGADFGTLTLRAQHHFCEERLLAAPAPR